MLGYIPGGRGYQPFDGGGGNSSSNNDKTACKLATTANITLSGLQTIDGVMTVAGDRVLVKNQTPDSGSGNVANGIYEAAAGAWTRTTDANTWSELIGAFVFVTAGSTLASTGWRCIIAPGGTIGVNNISWAQVSGVGTYTASNGVQLIGNNFSLTNTSVTLGSYGSVAKTLTLTVDQKGRLTAIAATDIAILAAQVTNFSSAALLAIGKTNNAIGWSLAGGTTSKTLTLADNSTIDQDLISSATPLWANLKVGSATKYGLVRYNTTDNLLDLQSYSDDGITPSEFKINSEGGNVSINVPLGMAGMAPITFGSTTAVIAPDGQPQFFLSDATGAPLQQTMAWFFGNAVNSYGGGVTQSIDFTLFSPLKTFFNPLGGNVGIGGDDLGNPYADYPLHVHGKTCLGTFDGTGIQLVLRDETFDQAQLQLGYNNDSGFSEIQSYSDFGIAESSAIMLNRGGGNVGIGISETQSLLSLDGDIYLANTTTPSQPTLGGKLYCKNNGGTSGLYFLNSLNEEYPYYTQVQFDLDFAEKSTTDLAEGSNLYYTATRFNTAFAAKSTTNLTEGSNLYFTQARAIASPLTGLSVTNSAIVAADTILQAFGKAQGQINAIASPLTTKGDLYTFSTVNARLAVGTNGQFLVADSTQTTGLKWTGVFTNNATGFSLAGGTTSKTLTITNDASLNQNLLTTSSPTFAAATITGTATSGTLAATGGWLSGIFGGTSGNRIVMGLLNGVASLGAHNFALSAWAALYIQPENGGFTAFGLSALSSQTPNATIHGGGSTILGIATAAVADASVYNGQMNIWYDQTNTKIGLKAKSSSGVVTNFSIPTNLGNLNIVSKVASYTAVATDDIIQVNSTSGAVVITVSSLAMNRYQTIRKTTGNNDITIRCAATQTINGSANDIIIYGASYQGYITLYSSGDGTNMYIFGQDISRVSASAGANWLPQGMQYQWDFATYGPAIAPLASITVNLLWPAAFPTAIFHVFPSVLENTAGVALSIKVRTQSTSGATIEVTNLSATTATALSTPIKALAIGN